MLNARWIKNKENCLIRVWIDEIETKNSQTHANGMLLLNEIEADKEEEIPGRKHLVLAWTNPKHRRTPLAAPVAVINDKQEIGLLVGRCSKYAKLLKLRRGRMQLWTVPAEMFDADWRASHHPAHIDIQHFLAHIEKFGADKNAMAELEAAQASLEALHIFTRGVHTESTPTRLAKAR